MLNQALCIAGEKGHAQANTGHLLLAILRAGPGPACTFLQAKNVTEPRVEQKVAAQGGAANTFAAAVALAIGIGLQNFPEGAAISLPLKKEGLSNTRSFIYGALSGIVEPIGGILTVLIAGSVSPVMPWLLAFAAGAMIYVVVEELIPEAHLGEHSHVGTIGVMFGFLVMMILDVALG